MISVPKEKKFPLITVITVVLNGVENIEKTILSVICQTYPSIEYIIIDGGSTDNTLNIVKKYSHRIDYLISEKDDGIYDAMNKGIRLASGDWINFMNAGDSLFFDLHLINKFNSKNIPFVYGNAIVVDQWGSPQHISGKAVRQFDLITSMPVCHQAIFYSKYFIIPYDLRYKIIADRVMTYILMESNFEPYYDCNIKVKYLEDGMSYNNYNLKLKDELLFLNQFHHNTFRRRIACFINIYIKSFIYNIKKKYLLFENIK
jgi:glycosyltransferase involved in cell wall biosynthesis